MAQSFGHAGKIWKTLNRYSCCKLSLFMHGRTVADGYEFTGAAGQRSGCMRNAAALHLVSAFSNVCAQVGYACGWPRRAQQSLLECLSASPIIRAKWLSERRIRRRCPWHVGWYAREPITVVEARCDSEHQKRKSSRRRMTYITRVFYDFTTPRLKL